jgi:hypothetical protein
VMEGQTGGISSVISDSVSIGFNAIIVTLYTVVSFVISFERSGVSVSFSFQFLLRDATGWTQHNAQVPVYPALGAKTMVIERRFPINPDLRR